MSENSIRARTVRGFCDAYGIGITTTYKLLKQGKLQGVKFNRQTLILEDSAQAWLDSLTPKYTHKSDANEGEGGRRTAFTTMPLTIDQQMEIRRLAKDCER